MAFFFPVSKGAYKRWKRAIKSRDAISVCSKGLEEKRGLRKGQWLPEGWGSRLWGIITSFAAFWQLFELFTVEEWCRCRYPRCPRWWRRGRESSDTEVASGDTWGVWNCGVGGGATPSPHLGGNPGGLRGGLRGCLRLTLLAFLGSISTMISQF